jgi:serine/threonine-protein kinase
METLTKAGRYEIVGELGRGAMGVVYKAMDPVIGRTVAVKTIRLSEEGTGMSRQELLQRFQMEARAAGLLTHPNIVVVYDAGEEEGGLFYITMELVEGKSLQAQLDAQQAFPLPRVLRILEQSCSALQFAHERSVVHRDIKPANLMLTADDTVKVTDFGTAKILQFGTTHQTAHVIGTPSYMSPEQVKGRAVDGRSDIFSLGVLFYEMVTGEKPFPGQNITTVIYKIVNESPVPPRQIDSSVHPGISYIAMKALEKDPDARYQSCREMLEDLKNYRSLGGGPESTIILPTGQVEAVNAAALAARQSSAGTAPSTPAVRRTGSIQPLQPTPKKSRVTSIFLALALLGIIAYSGYRLRPYMRDLWQRTHGVQQETPNSHGSAPADPNTPQSASDPANQGANAAPNAESAATESASPVEATAEPAKLASPPEKAVSRRLIPPSSIAAAEFRGRVEQGLANSGLAGRVKVEGTGNTLTLSGKLRPQEHAALLKHLRAAPAGVRIVDHIEYDDTPVSGGEGGDHPVPLVGRGAIHVLTDVIGATAVLRGPRGRALIQCQTPCSFNNLFPAAYGLEVKKDGYKPVTTALQVKSGDVLEQRILLESTALGLFVNTKPQGAEVYINGAKQSGQTPVTLPLAQGEYTILIRKEGFEPYAGHVQVKENIQTQLEVELIQHTVHVAWVMVRTQPRGAEIFVDGNSTGRFTPARVQMTSGMHTISLQLPGFSPAIRKVAVDEGQTVQVFEVMKLK